MKKQLLVLAPIFLLTGSAFAEGGCDPGYTPQNNGQNWICVPGGNDEIGNSSQESQVSSQSTGWWEYTWGAIATSDTRGVLGASTGASSKEEADRLAFADCRAKGGEGCTVDLTYHHQCAAMVVGDKFLSLFNAPTIGRATENGIKACNQKSANCRVYYSACTEPIFHRY